MVICPGQTRIRANHLVTLIPALSRSDVRCFFSITAKLKSTRLRIVFRDELAFQSAAARHCPPEEVRVVMSEVTGGVHTVTRPARSHLRLHKHTDARGRAPYGGVCKCERLFMQLSLMESVYLIVIWFVLTL